MRKFVSIWLVGLWIFRGYLCICLTFPNKTYTVGRRFLSTSQHKKHKTNPSKSDWDITKILFYTLHCHFLTLHHILRFQFFCVFLICYIHSFIIGLFTVAIFHSFFTHFQTSFWTIFEKLNHALACTKIVIFTFIFTLHFPNSFKLCSDTSFAVTTTINHYNILLLPIHHSITTTATNHHPNQ